MTAFRRGESGNPKGRPKGSLTWREKLAQSLRDDAPALLDRLKALARDGDLQALRFLLERVIPPARGQAVPVELPALAAAGTLTEKADAVLAAVGAGEIAPDVGAQLLTALGTVVRITEVEELTRRIEALEAADHDPTT